uniref:Uncharacterized protein n=1 Tax=Plectus sambesii TaxID=2011161 RepID=A0A914UWV5_9BILA
MGSWPVVLDGRPSAFSRGPTTGARHTRTSALCPFESPNKRLVWRSRSKPSSPPERRFSSGAGKLFPQPYTRTSRVDPVKIESGPLRRSSTTQSPSRTTLVRLTIFYLTSGH